MLKELFVMLNMRRKVIIAGMVGALALSGMAFADAVLKSPAEILSGLTGKTTEQLYGLKNDGRTFGAIAKDEGRLDEFQKAALEQKKSVLDQRVKDGKITQATADKIYSQLEGNQANCDGTGSSGDRIGRENGMGFGQGMGQGHGRGDGTGRGFCVRP
jgi:hypothetical protein